ncbi:MAG TPA: hypothetical protein VJ550_01040 [Geomonas sp.]|nr:hypothetical protein [Geomonas sp.]
MSSPLTRIKDIYIVPSNLKPASVTLISGALVSISLQYRVRQIKDEGSFLMASRFIDRVRRIFAPTYNELVLFSLSFTCVLFFVTGFRSTFGSGNFVLACNGIGPIVLMLIIAGGVCLSLFHALSKRKKGRFEKQVMFLFAALMNGFSGIWGGTYLLSKAETLTWIAIFPVFNIISSYLIFSITRDRVLEEECIDDNNVRLREVALSALIISFAFIVTRHFLLWHWTATLSICVFYGTNLNRVIVNALFPERSSR